eukprot:5260598-Prymnesium_polylepis.1
MSYCIPSALLVEMTGPRARRVAAQCGRKVYFYLAYTRAIESVTPLCTGRACKYEQGYGLLLETRSPPGPGPHKAYGMWGKHQAVWDPPLKQTKIQGWF